MASGRKGKSKGKQRERNSDRRPLRGPSRARLRLFANPLFAPIVGLWAALLGGMVVAVVPRAHIEALTADTVIATFDVPVKLVLAGSLAALLGLIGFGLAAHRSAAARRRLNPHAIGDVGSRKVNPIDPARDLGTRSIDDPIETMPFASPAWRDADLDAPAEDADADERLPDFMRRRPYDGEAEVPASVAAAAAAPVELDLAAFAELPGRNAVWIEAPAPTPAPVAAPADPAAEPRPAPVPAPAPAPEARRAAVTVPPVPGTAALSLLRSVPANALSIAQMVERFAGALHEHRANAPARALSAAELAAREAALAEALKALAVLSGVEPAPAPAPADREAPLRAALTQLHPRRGAA